MKNFNAFILVGFALTPLLTHASNLQPNPHTPLPNVSCELTYEKSDPETGLIEKNVRGERASLEANTDIENKNFIVVTVMKENCASDGVHCSGTHNLKIIIGSMTNPQIRSTTEVTIDPNKPRARYSASLYINGERGFVDCDLINESSEKTNAATKTQSIVEPKEESEEEPATQSVN